MCFYSTVFYFLFTIRNSNALNIKELIKALFIPHYWWLANTFIIALLFVPILQIIFRTFNKKINILAFAFLLSICSVIPTFIQRPIVDGLAGRVLLFLCLFYLGGIIKAYYDDYSINDKGIALLLSMAIVAEVFLRNTF